VLVYPVLLWASSSNLMFRLLLYFASGSTLSLRIPLLLSEGVVVDLNISEGVNAPAVREES